MSYNGWTNFATWRVNLEVFDGCELQDVTDNDAADLSDYELGIQLKEYAESLIFEVHSGEISELCIDYARCFLAQVNWMEIARGFLEE